MTAVIPHRIQLRRKAGFKLAEASRAANGLAAVNVARPNACGNPFPVDVYGQAEAVSLFDRFVKGEMSTLEMSQLSRCDRWSDRGVSIVTVRSWICEGITKAKGQNVACFCKLCSVHEESGRPFTIACPDCPPCHGDVVLRIANAGGANA